MGDERRRRYSKPRSYLFHIQPLNLSDHGSTLFSHQQHLAFECFLLSMEAMISFDSRMMVILLSNGFYAEAVPPTMSSALSRAVSSREEGSSSSTDGNKPRRCCGC
jgi:hypothetical protein